MVRALGLLYIAGPTVAVVVLLLPHPAARDELGIWILAAAAYAMAPIVFTQYTRLHPVAVSGLVLFANCLVTMVVFFDHDTSSPASFFYLWVTPYAMVFFSTRHALAHVAFAAVSYAVVLLILAGRGEGGSEAAHWVHTIGALVVTVLLVRALELALRSNLASIDAERRRRALEINDDVVQRLVLARQSHADGDGTGSDAEVAVALDRARTIMADLIAAEGVAPGSLRRDTASTESQSDQTK